MHMQTAILSVCKLEHFLIASRLYSADRCAVKL